MINVLARQHTSYGKSLLGHMSDQTVVWVYCPMARHGQRVTKRQEKGREEVWIPQVCECQWFVRSHPRTQTAERTNAPVQCCETAKLASDCLRQSAVDFLFTSFFILFWSKMSHFLIFDRRTGHRDVAFKIEKKTEKKNNSDDNLHIKPLQCTKKMKKKVKKPQSG